MPAITELNLSIERDSFPEGSLCTIHYSYQLMCKPGEVQAGHSYIVSCQLWGKDVLSDDLLGDDSYDAHSLLAARELRIARHFMVPCDLLDEALGRDHIYLRLWVRNDAGMEISRDSLLISERF